MKKVLFLMLFLVILGAVNVYAQVRIGGNAAPNASAVLDLNADDTNSGNKGLALPRVALTSNTMLLPGVTSNLTGMMVYNTSITGTGVNRIGIYYWNGANWIMASLPSATPADQGRVLVYDGVSWIPAVPFTDRGLAGTATIVNSSPTASLSLVASAYITNHTQDYYSGDVVTVNIQGLAPYDICSSPVGAFSFTTFDHLTMLIMTIWPLDYQMNIKCYRPTP